jgi:hypothetical protein
MSGFGSCAVRPGFFLILPFAPNSVNLIRFEENESGILKI